MPNTYVALATETLAVATNTVTFSLTGISGYTDLVLVSNTVGTASFYSLRLNADATALYSRTRLVGDGTSATSSRQSGQTEIIIDGLNSTNRSMSTIHFMNYSNTTTNKTILARTAFPSTDTAAIVGLYRNTAAITSISLFMNSNSFSVGSTFSLYGIANADQGAAKATGGMITEDSQYWYHTFAASGTFTPKQSLTCDYLVVAGGGAGGGQAGQGTGRGGGGAGGFRTSIGGSPLSLTAIAYAVTVGAGGVGDTDTGTNGSDSIFSTITSTGGGAGSGATGAAYNGNSGGSGGGGTFSGTGGAGNTPSTSPSQGSTGGNGNSSGGNYGGGGGGGASAVGNNGTSSIGGNGGAGTASLITGTSITYAGGGGGGTSAGGTPGTGGSGGGGTGTTNAINGGNATANTGGGGGATGGLATPGASNGGNGGSGIVIVRYAK